MRRVLLLAAALALSQPLVVSASFARGGALGATRQCVGRMGGFGRPLWDDVVERQRDPGRVESRLCLAATGAGVSVPRLADLAVVGTGRAAGRVAPAGLVVLSVTVANVGAVGSGVGEVRFVLARGRAPGPGDVEFAARLAVRALRPGQRARAASLFAVVPASVRAGSYELFACVRESPPARERLLANNCRAAGRVRVVVGRPLAVTPVAGASHAVTTLVGPEGGTVDAKTPTGGTVRLVLPAHALLEQVLVRLVPLARLDRFALAGAALVGGVEIEPAGMLLNVPARLEMTPAVGAAAASLAVGWDPGGRDAHLVPFVRTPAFAALVTRFAGFALVSAHTPTAVAPRMALPSSPFYRVEQALARAELDAAHRGTLSASERRLADSSPAEVQAEMVALANASYSDVIQPELLASLGAATLDLTAADAAQVRALNLIRQLELMGFPEALDDENVAELQTLVERLMRRAFDRRVQLCRHGDVSSAVGMIAFTYRFATRGIGQPFSKPLDKVLGADFLTRAAPCWHLRFHIDINTTNTFDKQYQGDATASFEDVGWTETASGITAFLDGYNQDGPASTKGELKWTGTAPLRIDSVLALPRAHAPPNPDNPVCDTLDNAAYRRYSNPHGTESVTLVPVVEAFDPHLGKQRPNLQLRWANSGGIDSEYTCGDPATGGYTDAWGGLNPFSDLSAARDFTGAVEIKEKGLPTRHQRWYSVPQLQGGSLTLAESGNSPSGACGWPCSWSTHGSLTVNVIPPR